MDLSKLSDDGLIKLFQAYSTRAEPPQQTPGQMAAQDTGSIPVGPFNVPVPQSVGAAAIGSGKVVNDLVESAKQLYSRATGDQQALQTQEAQQADEGKNYAALKELRPYATGFGESLPGMAAMLATGGSTALPTALLKAGAANGLTEAARYGTDQERLNRGVVGAGEGALGTLAGYGLGKLITPRGAIPGAGPSTEAMDAAERLGVQLTPGQRTGGVVQRKIEQMLAQQPGSAGEFAKLQAANTTAINRAAAGAMGETADVIDSGVFAAARQRIGDTFNRITKNVDVKLGNDFLDSLGQVLDQHAQTIPSLRSPLVPKVVDDALNLAAKGQMSGEAYQATRSQLSQAAKDAFAGNNSQLGQSLKTVLSALDDAAGQSMTATEKAAFKEAQKQWGAMRTLEKGNVVSNGNVSPALLKGRVQQGNPVGYKTGQMDGPLADIARYSEGVKPLADSGSPAGMMAAGMTTNPLALLQAITTTPLRYGAAKAMLHPKGADYLSNGLLTEEMKRRLMQTGGLLGAGAGPSQ